MQFYHFFIALITLSAAFSYLNSKYMKLPYTIGLMVLGMVFSLGLVLGKGAFPELFSFTQRMMADIDFSQLILDIMLPFLLFAGALHTDGSLLRQEKRSVAVFSVVGVILSTVLIGAMLYYAAQLLELSIPFIYCLLFGSLISPTDPIAVLGILTKAGVPKKIEINIVGESLFNDGVGVVIFISILEIIRSSTGDFDLVHAILLFLQEAGGGLVFGWLMGVVLIRFLKSIDHFETEVLITLSVVMAGYLIAQRLHVSGALAVVIAGLRTGGKGKEYAMSATTELYVFKFWELVDVLLNAILFLLMGMRVMTLEPEPVYFVLSAVAIVIVLTARLLSVYSGVMIVGARRSFGQPERLLLVWGGLRGGLSIALALSLKQTPEKDILVFVTYGVVLFSIIVQGLSIGAIVKKMYPPNTAETVVDSPENLDD